jgi:hypothetical protein
MAFPKTIFQAGKFLKQTARGNTFEAVDQFGNLVSRFSLQDDMNMIYLGFKRNQATPRFGNQVSKDLFEAITDGPTQDRAAVFNAPNKMIGQEVN